MTKSLSESKVLMRSGEILSMQGNMNFH